MQLPDNLDHETRQYIERIWRCGIDRVCDAHEAAELIYALECEIGEWYPEAQRQKDLDDFLSGRD